MKKLLNNLNVKFLNGEKSLIVQFSMQIILAFWTMLYCLCPSILALVNKIHCEA